LATNTSHVFTLARNVDIIVFQLVIAKVRLCLNRSSILDVRLFVIYSNHTRGEGADYCYIFTVVFYNSNRPISQDTVYGFMFTIITRLLP